MIWLELQSGEAFRQCNERTTDLLVRNFSERLQHAQRVWRCEQVRYDLAGDWTIHTDHAIIEKAIYWHT